MKEITRTLRFKDDGGKFKCNITTREGDRVEVTPGFIPSVKKSYRCIVRLNGQSGVARILKTQDDKLHRFSMKGKKYVPNEIAMSVVETAMARKSPRGLVLDKLMTSAPSRVLAVMPDVHMLSKVRTAEIDVVPSASDKVVTAAAAAAFGACIHNVDFVRMLCPIEYDAVVVNLNSKDEGTGASIGRIIHKLRSINTARMYVISDDGFDETRLRAALVRSGLKHNGPTVRYGDKYGFVLEKEAAVEE